MLPRIEELARDMIRQPGASSQELQDMRDFFASTNFSPPHDYIEFMKESNGAEGSVGQRAYLAIYSIQEMREHNAARQALEPQLLFFGSNRGGEAYAFDLSRADKQIIAIEEIDLDRTYAADMGSTLLEFLEGLDAHYS
jgi:SMI1 / KNR4 family (SUKH-1)